MVKLKGYTYNETLYENPGIIVYRGIREQDNKPVVIKILKAERPTPQEIEHMERDYRISKNLTIPGILKPYTLATLGHRKVMINEDIDGVSLKHYMDNHNPGLISILLYAKSIVEILGHIHKNGLIHKDIKPHNIIINSNTEEIRIIDFSIAAEVERETMGAVSPNIIEGTLAYISPEQTGRMNRSIDYRSDFYSFGVSFYEMLTGKLPFMIKDQMELVHAHIAVKPVSPCVMNPDIPKTVSNIVMKLLAKTAEERYQGASGLMADLEKCYHQLTEKAKIDDFAIGTSDISERFQIPEKLYGREEEINHLMNVFNRVSTGTKEIVYYSGISGIGKSALIHDIQKTMVAKKAYFISGKFDRYKRNIPYHGIIQAFEELARHIITETEDILAQWQEKILRALGDNGRLIIDIIPALEIIIGAQTQVQELSPAEAQNRFNLVFQNFIRVFADQTHPLVLFLDDLQWADNPSLQLLEALLSDPELNYLLFLGAYRDNEIDGLHPLTTMLSNMKKEGAQWENIKLTTLSEEDIAGLLSDTLYCDTKKAKPFARLLHSKTNGNPFFAAEFLKSLYNNNLIEFKNEWTWDMSSIEQTEITENVVELLANKIKKLSSDTLNVLKIAAVIGGSFHLNTLAQICAKTENETFNDLKEPINEGMLLSIEGSYQFVHTRVQEGAYSLLDINEKKMLHYRIGKFILNNAKKEKTVDENLFDIVNQLNPALELIAENEKLEVLDLNLKAALKAKASSAYDLSLEFFKKAAELLPYNYWDKDYDTSLKLYTEWAESEYISGNVNDAKKLFNIVLSNAKNLLDKMKVYSLEIEYYLTQHEYEKELKLVLQALKELGVNMPDKPGKLAFLPGFLKTKIDLRHKNIEDLIDLPKVTDPKINAIMNMLVRCGEVSYFAYPNYFPITIMKTINWSIRYGNSVFSPIAYLFYGVILSSVLGDIDKGYKFAKLGLDLANKNSIKTIQGQQYHGYCFVAHFKEPLKNHLDYYQKGIQFSMDAGDFQYVMWMYNHYSAAMFFIGENLLKVNEFFNELTVHIKKLKQPDIYFTIWKLTVINILGESEDSLTLQRDDFDENEILPLFIETNDVTGLAHFYIAKTILSYLFSDNKKGLESAQNAEKNIEGVLGLQYYPIFFFYYALILVSLFPEANKNEQKQYLKKIKQIQKKYKKWADHNQFNYLHKYLLISAEIDRICNDNRKLSLYYDQAIKIAHENEFTQEEAIANECAALFYLSKGDEERAANYMTNAYYCYSIWGARPKFKDLLEKYPALIAFEGSQAERTAGTNDTVTGLSGSSDSLDISTIMKATQTISAEIEMENLLQKMIRIVIENAGAQKGILILIVHDQFLIEAESEIDKEMTSVMQSVPLNESKNLPQAVIRYVAKVKENIVLNNASEEDLFKNDAYILNDKPKSVLCLPILKQNHLIAVIYLENNLAVGAFTEDRVKTLNILSSQIAISIENVKLIESMKENERLKQEMEIAERIQTSLLPTKSDNAHFEIAAAMKTAEEVGGDYYDYRNDPHGNLWFAIGDVTGHGVTPGLIMMMVQTCLSSILNDPKVDFLPHEALMLINKTIFDNVTNRLHENHFMTFTLLKHNGNGTLYYAGAHLDIIVYRHKTDQCELIQTKGTFLNLIEDISHATEDYTLSLEKDDIMILYSDGIVEAKSADGHLMDIRGLLAVIEKNAKNHNMEELKDIIINHTLQWCNQQPDDDISLVLAKRL